MPVAAAPLTLDAATPRDGDAQPMPAPHALRCGQTSVGTPLERRRSPFATPESLRERLDRWASTGEHGGGSQLWMSDLVLLPPA